MNLGAPNCPIASLYVGNLHHDVTEEMLLDKFSSAGHIVTIHVCRDIITYRSLGYGFINFEQPADAERALDTMNYDIIKGKPIRVLWSHPYPSVRESGIDNVFIKNLDKNFDNNNLYDTFSKFGTILSCKIAQDENGNSKGFGFVQFYSQVAANKSIEKLNGITLHGKKVYVNYFIPRQEREKQLGEKAKRFTNVYVKNFGETFTEDMLKGMFEKYGRITSHTIMRKDDGKSRGFGFVAFEEPSAAEQAIVELNGKELVQGKAIYVGRAKKKAERQQEIESLNHYQGVNLYVKNLDNTVDDERLREAFMQFGTIRSAKVMFEDGRSKGFGFVCFSSLEEATKAVMDMNGHIVGTKPLYVALAQRKEDRKAYLASLFMQRMPNVRMQQMDQTFQPNNTDDYFIPTIPQRSYSHAQKSPIRMMLRWPSTSQVRPNIEGGTSAYPSIQNAFRGADCAPGQRAL